MLRGAKDSFPLLVGMTPFGLVCGIMAQGVGMSVGEISLMSGLVYAGAAQVVALAIWGHPPDLISVTLAAFVVNLRFALMGPVLAPWLNHMRGWRLWGSLFMTVDQNWALSLREMNAGGRDAGYLMGSGMALWLMWVGTSALGHILGSQIRPEPGHPLFFTALGVFVAMLATMWRGRVDVLPWAVAGCVSAGMAQLLPGTFYYIVAGALAGSITGGLRDRRREKRAA